MPGDLSLNPPHHTAGVACRPLLGIDKTEAKTFRHQQLSNINCAKINFTPHYRAQHSDIYVCSN